MATGTRQRILDRALELFIAHGVAGTTVVTIEKAAGLSPGSGSFYRHFQDKDAVLRAIVERELERMGSERDRLVATSQGLIEDLRDILVGLDMMRGLIQLLARGALTDPDLFERVRAVLVEEGSRFEARRLQERMNRGELRPGDPTALAAVIMHALVGFHLAEGFFDASVGGVDRDRFVETLADLLTRHG